MATFCLSLFCKMIHYIDSMDTNPKAKSTDCTTLVQSMLVLL